MQIGSSFHDHCCGNILILGAGCLTFCHLSSAPVVKALLDSQTCLFEGLSSCQLTWFDLDFSADLYALEG